MRPGDRIDDGERVDLVSEEFDVDRLVGPAQEYVHRIPPDAEGAALEIHFGAAVVGIHQVVQQSGEASALLALHQDRLGVKVLGVADAVEAGDAGYDDYVPPSGHQSGGCAETQLVDLVVDAEVFFDVGVGDGQVGFRLVVVVYETKYSTAFAGKKDLNSPYNWAARVLLWLRMRAGRWSFWMTLAMVKVFPEPVTPRRAMSLTPSARAVLSWLMASGWSPDGL